MVLVSEGPKMGNLGQNVHSCVFRRAKTGDVGDQKGKNGILGGSEGQNAGSDTFRRVRSADLGLRRGRNGQFWGAG